MIASAMPAQLHFVFTRVLTQPKISVMNSRRAALSVRQPYADQILRGTKKYEYRSIPTRIRGRVYIYATLKQLPRRTKTLIRGRILGTVEVIACEWSTRNQCYRWKLSRPRRILPRIPRSH